MKRDATPYGFISWLSPRRSTSGPPSCCRSNMNMRGTRTFFPFSQITVRSEICISKNRSRVEDVWVSGAVRGLNLERQYFLRMCENAAEVKKTPNGRRKKTLPAGSEILLRPGRAARVSKKSVQQNIDFHLCACFSKNLGWKNRAISKNKWNDLQAFVLKCRA